MRFSSIVACVSMAPLLTAASQPIRLQPSSQWIVDYAENSCRLIRSFGDGDNKTTLLLESDAPDEGDMVLIGSPLRGDAEEVPARFLPVQKDAMKGRRVTAAKDQPALLFSTVYLLPADQAAELEAKRAQRQAHPELPPAPLNPAEEQKRRSQRQAFAQAATELEIDARKGRPVILETGSLGAPVNAFDKCSRDSLRDWGVDPDLQDKIVKPAWLTNKAHLISSEEYPAKMLDEGQQSEVRARVLLDATGRVTKCTSLSHFKLQQFNQLVCDKISARGVFKPAELADGTKVPSYDTVRIVFQIAQ